MKQLKTLAKNIKVNFVRVGFNPETEQTKFIALINGESFDFHCGLRACIPDKVPRVQQAWQIAAKEPPVMINPLKRLEQRYKLSSGTNDWRVFELIMQGKVHARNNMQHPNVLRVFEDISALCSPTAYDLLYCLQSDCQAAEGSFDDFCSNFGYDNDSIKALNTYNACCEGAKKLRKALGPELYAEVMAADPE